MVIGFYEKQAFLDGGLELGATRKKFVHIFCLFNLIFDIDEPKFFCTIVDTS